ncbi:unnamed protein product [Rodentolepis nana]|uniref:DM10 domain-containing protein n=1 Tax=Rodentolepis nana TaxID=102285 RepID=A0A0R3T7D9_RODNA|nr:unnamed protein product [Rodentolepis nana]
MGDGTNNRFPIDRIASLAFYNPSVETQRDLIIRFVTGDIVSFVEYGQVTPASNTTLRPKQLITGLQDCKLPCRHVDAETWPGHW